MEELLVITEKFLENGKSVRGAWSMKQIRLLGIRKLYKGWKDDIIGNPITKQNYDKFLELKNKHLSRKKIMKHEKAVQQLRIDGIDL